MMPKKPEIASWDTVVEKGSSWFARERMMLRVAVVLLLALAGMIAVPVQNVTASSVHWVGAADRIGQGGGFSYRLPNQPGQQTTPQPSESAGTPSPVGIVTSTPNADGSIAHVVKLGETLIEIAQAYGISLTELYANNPSLDPQNPKYYEGEVLFIRLANTKTPVVSPTVTPRTPTHTVRPSRTVTVTGTPIPQQKNTPTPDPSPTPAAKPLALDDRTIGYGFILVSLVGLVVVIFKGFIKAK